MEREAGTRIDGEPGFELTLAGVFVPLLKRTRLLALGLFLGSLGGIAFYLFAPREYESRLTILPAADSGLGGLGALAELGSMAGIQLPVGDDESALYADVIRSDRILLQLLDDVAPAYGGETLRQFLELDEEEGHPDALEELRERIVAHRDTKTGLLRVRVLTPQPEASKHIGERILELLDEYYRETSAGKAARLRVFLDERLDEVRGRLRDAESALTRFRQQNRADLNSPTLRQEEARLQREVLIQETLFVELTKQVELARVSEKKDLPVIRVLDRPRAPLRQASPRPLRSALLGLLLGGVLATVWIYFREYVVGIVGDLRRRAASASSTG